MRILIVLNGGGFHKTGRLDEITRKSLLLAVECWKDSKADLIIVTGGHLHRGFRLSRAMKLFGL